FDLFHDVVRQYIFISSATVYAKPPARLPLTENAPLGNAWWDYAQKKLACEQWLRERHDQIGFPVTIVRPSHTYTSRSLSQSAIVSSVADPSISTFPEARMNISSGVASITSPAVLTFT